MVGIFDWIRLVRAVVREKGNLGMFQFHHNPQPKTSLHPSQTNLEKNQVRRQVKSLVRNQVKSLTPSLSPNQSFSIVSFVERMVIRESFAIREREARMAKEWANKDRYHPSHGVPEPRMPLPKGKGFVCKDPAWGDEKSRSRGGGLERAVRPAWLGGQTGPAQGGRSDRPG
jgi:hypothetical protein